MHEGQIVGGYRIDLLIGEGAVGWVYQGDAVEPGLLDRLDHPTVAIKILKPHATADPAVVASFLYEARILARLDHPNVMRAIDQGDDGDWMYLVTELLAGEPLNVPLGKAKRFDADRTTRIGRQLADGLHHIHERGYVHRDLKPSNLILDSADHLKIMDFGTVVSAGAGLSYEKGVFGTPSFFSPEQATQQPTIDGRSDLYTAGVILFLMATGVRPFEGTREEIITGHVTAAPPRPSDIAEVPDDLEAIILRCLEKDPDDRFTTGADLAEALDGLDLAASPRPVGGLRRMFRRARS